LENLVLPADESLLLVSLRQRIGVAPREGLGRTGTVLSLDYKAQPAYDEVDGGEENDYAIV
jgi:hypothetical protein